jgi:HlyD family secretion protein
MTRQPVFAMTLVAFGVGGCNGADDPARLIGTLERDRVEIVSEAAEPIVAIHVREGEKVERGQLLLQQDTATSAARLAEADAHIEEARQRLEELERGARPETLQEARARVAAAETALDRDERELRRTQDLVERRLVSQAEADRARAARDGSAARLREARAPLLALERGTRIEQVSQARAAVAATQAARRELAVRGARLDVHATRAGTVEALPYEIGERPPAGAPVAILLAADAPYARVYVPEPLRARVRPSASAGVHVDGMAKPFPGRVRYVSSQASFTPYYALTQRDRSRLAFLAEVELASEADLPAGVPVEVEIAGVSGE